MDFKGLWDNFTIFGGRRQQNVKTTQVLFQKAVHCDIGGLRKRKSTTPARVYPRLEGTKTRSPIYRKRDLSVQENRFLQKEPPRAFWKKFTERAEKRRFSSGPLVTLEDPNEDIIDLEPPPKKNKMETKSFRNGSTFDDAKDVEIVKVVSGSKSLKTFYSSMPKRKMFGFTKNRKSTVMLEEQNEEKRKYKELLSSHVYSIINRNKRSSSSQNSYGISQNSFGLAMEAIKSQTPDPKNAKCPTEVIDLTKEKKEPVVVPTRVEVNRRHSITPVTQATEKPDVVVDKTDFKKRSSAFFLRRPETVNFLKNDFIEQLRRNHLSSMKATKEEIEQEKKKLELCGKISMAAEKQKKDRTMESLEQRMKDYLKITESFPEEEEVEIIPPLPELTEQMQREIDAALSRGNPNQVFADAFNLKINRRDIHTLQGLNWLNDEVINFYMNLLMDRGKQDNYPSVYAFNTFFYPKLVSGGHGVLKRWTKKVDIFSYDFVVAPVHLGVHWCMAVIDMNKKVVMYFDSMGGRNEQCLTALKQYLSDEKMDKKKEKLDISEWEFRCMKDIPQQMNGSDCGMFSCMYAEYTCRRASISFTQEDMPYFRRKMIYEIIKVKLLS